MVDQLKSASLCLQEHKTKNMVQTRGAIQKEKEETTSRVLRSKLAATSSVVKKTVAAKSVVKSSSVKKKKKRTLKLVEKSKSKKEQSKSVAKGDDAKVGGRGRGRPRIKPKRPDSSTDEDSDYGRVVREKWSGKDNSSSDTDTGVSLEKSTAEEAEDWNDSPSSTSQPKKGVKRQKTAALPLKPKTQLPKPAAPPAVVVPAPVVKRNIYDETDAKNKSLVAQEVVNPFDKSIRNICPTFYTDFTKEQSDINTYTPSMLQKAQFETAKVSEHLIHRK